MNLGQLRISFLAAATFFASIAIIQAQTDQGYPYHGTWTLNLAKSDFGNTPAPKSGQVTITPDNAFRSEGVAANGQPMRWSHANSIGKEVPIDGVPNGTIISTLNGNVVDDTLKVSGKVIETIHAVASQDGAVITATITGTDQQGNTFKHTEVYEKQ